MRRLAVLLLIISSFFPNVYAAEIMGVQMLNVYNVDDFGANPNDANDDGIAIKNAIQAAIAGGSNARVVFSSGKYIVNTQYNSKMNGVYAFEFSNANNMIIEGNQTEIVFSDPFVGGFRWSNCNDLTMKGIALDYKVPSFIQGKVANVDIVNGSFEYIVDEGYTTIDDLRMKNDTAIKDVVWGNVRDKSNPFLFKKSVLSDAIFLYSWDKLQNGNYQIVLKDNFKKYISYIEKDDIFVFAGAIPDNHTLSFKNSANINLTDFCIYTSPALAIGGTFVENFHINNLKIIPRPNSNRILSTRADGVHLNSSRQGATIENSTFWGMGDDAINFYNKPGYITEIISDTVFKMFAPVNILVGDTIEVSSKQNGLIKGTAIVMSKQQISTDVCQITVGTPILGMQAGTSYENADNVYNYNASGGNFIIRNNIFNGNRRFGVLLRTRGGVVSNNKFYNLSNSAIILENDMVWNEGPMCSDINIESNLIENCGYLGNKPSINIYGTCLSGISQSMGQQNITVKNNVIRQAMGNGIVLVSAKDCTIINNTIEKIGSNTVNGTYINNSSNITVKSFIVIDPFTIVNSSNNLVLTTNIKNVATDGQDVMVAGGIYKEDSLLKFSYDNKVIPANTSKLFTVNLDTTQLSKPYTLKIFTWENLNILRPMTLSKEIFYTN